MSREVNEQREMPQEQSTQPLLQLVDLEVAFRSSTGMVPAVRKANLTIYPGQHVAIVGESGSGKSTLAHAVIGLLPGTGKVIGGKILFDGDDVVKMNRKQLQNLRGSNIGLVPQDPMSNLNPVWRIGFQVKEALRANGVDKADLQPRVLQTLQDAGLPDAEARAKQFPHEFSGGMRQRALIAIGLANRPRLLIADEPTSALDVTVQRTILDHLERLTEELGSAVLFITHDLGLAAERAEYLVVMHRGRVVESGPALEILRSPQHPYTKRLVAAAPSLTSTRIESAKARAEVHETQEIDSRERSEHLLQVKNLVKDFALPGKVPWRPEKFRAVDDVSFNIRRGTTMALVGESGSGKSTVANIVLNLLEATSGSVEFDGTDVQSLNRKELFKFRRRVQPIFQNPYGSLDPMFSIYRIIEEPLRVHGIGPKQQTKKWRSERVAELLDMVALPKSTMRRYPNELSGGQRQRVAIARALALNPDLVVCDEAVSALDVLVQDQILHLLNDLQAELSLSYLFITHDLAVVRQLADDVAVMEKGKIVEYHTTDEVFNNPQEQYTKQLLAAIPGASIATDIGS